MSLSGTRSRGVVGIAFIRLQEAPMIQRKRILFSALMIVVLFASLWMMNPMSVQAAPKPTATPTLTPSPVPTLPPANYYVSVSGNDANPGTLAAPWRHIQYAMDRVGAGSTVNVLTGVYNEFVTFKNSGSSGNYIVLQNYTGNTPVIDGTGLPISGEVGLVTIANRQYVKLIGFEIRNLKAGEFHLPFHKAFRYAATARSSKSATIKCMISKTVAGVAARMASLSMGATRAHPFTISSLMAMKSITVNLGGVNQW